MLSAVVVAGLSLDDLAQLHESETAEALGHSLGGGKGLTHFAWIVPGTLMAALCIAALVPAMAAAKPRPRRLLVLGTSLLFTGAIGFEAISGQVLEYTRHGLSYVAYDVVMHVEELLDLAQPCCSVLVFAICTSRTGNHIAANKSGGNPQ